MKETIKSMQAIAEPFLAFLRWEASSGVILLACAILALIVANSPLAESYEHLLHYPIAIGAGEYVLEMGLLHWINDGLMAVFFFVIGLEIKREFLYGELRTYSAMLLPVGAALGGMLVPAALYAAINAGLPTLGGWGIPMATDIAFALGIMTIAARQAPLGLVVFLTALAIVDDLGAIAVISSSLVGVGMAFAGAAYWSLATQGLVYVSINTFFQWHYSPWRPTLRGISFEPVRRMFRFSCKILATTIMTHVNNNVLNILLGHYFSPRDTGNYNQAYQWNTKCYSLVQSMVAQVAQPVLVSLGNEPGRQTDVFRKMMRFTAFIAFPLLLGFGLVAKEFIVLAIGEKWLASAALIQILCVAGATMPIATLFSNMIISKGCSGTFFWCTFSLGVVQIGVMMMLWRQGITRMVEAYTALNVVWLGVWLFFVRRLTGYGLRMFLRDVMPFALAAAAVMSAVHYATLSISNLWLLLGTRFVLAVAQDRRPTARSRIARARAVSE